MAGLNKMLLTISSIAAVSAIIGAIFAIWRWTYALKAFKLQKVQLMVQILMLDESREYWKTPKMKYCEEKSESKTIPTITEIVEEAKKAGLDIA